MTPHDTLARLTTDRAVMVVRSRTADDAKRSVEAAVSGGIRSVEITFTVPGASALIADLVVEYGSEVCIGAGTVLTLDQVDASVEAGASFLVSPGLDDDIVLAGSDRSVLTIPGTFTPSEVMRAVRLGALAVKLFPSNQFTPSYLATLSSPLPGIAIMPSGGISADNATAWLAAGAPFLGVGGSLSPLGPVDADVAAVIRAEAARLVAAVSPQS